MALGHFMADKPLSKSWSIFNAKASVTIPQRYRGYPLQTFDGRIPSEVLLEVAETPPAAPAVSSAGNFCSPSLQLLELDWNQEKSIEIQWFITTFPVSVVDPIINI